MKIYLAYSNSADYTFRGLDWTKHPAPMLVSYVYLDAWNKSTKAFPPGQGPTSRMLDSGAFSAWKSGKTIDIDALTQETRNPVWDESVTLDVVGDPVKSLENALYMKRHGSPAFPVFHVGEPMEILDEYVRTFHKVGLSCRFGEPEKTSLKFLDRCFARHWPKRFHSFGWVKESMLRTYPFHTADTASWVVQPRVYGTWRSIGKASVRGAKITNLTLEIDWYQNLAKRLQARWRQQMEELDGLEASGQDLAGADSSA